MRSVLEGISHSMVTAMRCYSDEGYPAGDISAVGGGIRNRIWVQAVSDISGEHQRIAHSLGACQGDAALAALAVGKLAVPSDCRRWVSWGSTVSPNRSLEGTYQMDHQRFIELYRRTRDLGVATGFGMGNEGKV